MTISRWFLDGQVAGAEPVSPVHYHARLVGTSVAEQARSARQRLADRLGKEPADRRVAVLHALAGRERDVDQALRVL
ncbi:hypothetical protein [Streptomyces sp. NPDC050504]|uniref:hypothetical protein n=1 Tax=Streptomyces sp. NPDC050504 TaxID=3365618 RepID=UPI0037900AC5